MREIFSNNAPNKGFISRKYKELKKPNDSKTNDQVEKVENKQGHFLKNEI